MKNTIFISVIVCLLLVGFPSKNFAGNCSSELIFQPERTLSSTDIKKSKPSFKEKVATWVLKKKMKSANQSRNEKKSTGGILSIVAMLLGLTSLTLGSLVFLFGLSQFLSWYVLSALFALLANLSVINFLKGNNGTKKQKDRVRFGLVLSLLSILPIAVLIIYYLLLM